MSGAGHMGSTSTSHSDRPRVTPGDRHDVGWSTWGFAALAGRVSGTNPPNLFLTLGRHRRVFRGWLHFAGTLMPGGRLPRRETELVILRVAHRQGCAYEYEHHVQLGRRAGVTAADLRRITGEDVAGDDLGVNWTPRESSVIATVDALLDHEDLDDTQWATISSHLSSRELIELVMLVGHYRMLATAITTLRIQPDEHRG